MKTYHFKKIILFSILLGLSQVSWAACTQTLSPGANVASAVSSAAAGSTICLNNGDFGNVNLAGINKSDYVTVQSVSGRGATISPQIGNSKFLRFTNLTINGATINACSSNIQLTSSTFTQGAFVSDRGFNCAYPLNITIDGSIFSNLSGAGYEGRISVVDDDGHQPSLGVIISNNEIRDGCNSDGVFLAGGASGVQIGPGNAFSKIIQSGTVHCDNIQIYGSGWHNSIIKNSFKDGTLMLVDSMDEGLIQNNVIERTMMQIAQTTNTTFDHNTSTNASLSINLGSTAVISNNIFVNTSYNPNAQGSISGCSVCTASYNLSTSAITGSNNLTGTPTFTGGSSPSTWAGWQLTSGSLGYHNGSNSNDRGTNYYNTGTSLVSSTPLASPSNLRVN